MTLSLRTFLLWVSLSATASAVSAQYQSGSWGTGFRIGASPYDLDGTGTGAILGPQADLALTRIFFGELSVLVFDHSADVSFAGVDASERTRFLLPELSVGAQGTFGRLQPYVLIGAGAAIRLNGSVDGGATLHAGLGTRFAIGGHTLLRAEGRARSIRPWTAETVDLAVGIEWTN